MRWAIAWIAIWPAFVWADDPSLLLPAKDKTLRLQLSIRATDQPPEQAHDAFLNRLFAFFDRDGNNSLSADEAARVFSLPSAAGRNIVMDFANLDADDDGKGSLAEFKTFYYRAGFIPIVAIFTATGADMARANAALFQRLDRDGDGKLSRAELVKAPHLLKTFDADGDEVLTIDELLVDAAQAEEVDKESMAANWSVTPTKNIPDGILSVAPGAVELRNVVAKTFDKNADEIRFPGGNLRVNAFAVDPNVRLKASSEFYLFPFKSALGDKKSLEQKVFEDDSSLAFLAPLVPYADRDGDQRLSLAELEAILDLVVMGVRSQIIVRITDEGASLLAALDENHDGRLDLQELKRAERILPKGQDALARQDISRRLALAVEHGSSAKMFGPLLIVGNAKPVSAKKSASPTGPKWFQAMDHNSDGRLSPSEFLGPPEVFAKLDGDGDGFIDVKESQRVGQ